MLSSCAKLSGVLPKAVGALGTLCSRLKHTLPDLPYDYNALEPYISAEIMQLHHKKHHQTYVNNLNIAEEKLAEAVATNDVNTTIKLQSAIRFNGGGHLNHSIFWETLSPHASEDIPKGDLREMICRDFGSVEDMKKEMSAASVAIQGSGWGWLAFNPVNKHLKIVTCANQDPLEATTGNIPLFGIDVWEHAYYLQYKNVRPDYVNAIWHIVNWENVSKRLHDAQMKT